MNICFITPAPPLRGGISTSSNILIKHLVKREFNLLVVSFKNLYPKILFPGKTQYNTKTEKSNTLFLLESMNPLSWIKTVNQILEFKPQVLFVRYWNPFFCLCLGYIIRKVKKENDDIKIVALCDNIFSHEKYYVPQWIYNFFFKSVDRFILISEYVVNDLKKIVKAPNYIKLFHPIYENYQGLLDKEYAKTKLNIKSKKVVLFFGLIRKYKGFEIFLEIANKFKLIDENILFLAVGESYEKTQKYETLINKYQLNKNFKWINEYIDDSEVHLYFSACDIVLLPYHNATQSGIIPLAYNYNRPVITNNVGGNVEMVKSNKSGWIVSENDVNQYIEIINNNIYNLEQVEDYINRKFKHHFSWESFMEQLIKSFNE